MWHEQHVWVGGGQQLRQGTGYLSQEVTTAVSAISVNSTATHPATPTRELTGFLFLPFVLKFLL